MKETFPFLKRYSAFILENHLVQLTENVIRIAKERELPILKLLFQLTEEELFTLSREGLKRDILIPLTEGKPFDSIKNEIVKWKQNAILVPKESINILDITSIHAVRKLALIEGLKEYKCDWDEGVDLIKEIETFFTTCIDLGLQAYEEIQRGELIEKNEILKGILSNIPIIVTRADSQGNITQSLGAGLGFLGFENHQLKGTNIFGNYPNAENVKKALQGESIAFIGTAKDKDGAARHYQNYFFPHYDGVLGFSLDITDRFLVQEELLKKQEELTKLNESLEDKIKERTDQLVKQKEYIYSVLMQAPAAISILKGRDLIYELSTPLYYEMVGRKELLGKPGREALPELNPQGVWDLLENVYATGNPFYGNEYLVKLDRNSSGALENAYFNFVATPLQNEEGQIEGIMIHATEVTRQVEANNKVKENAKRVLDVLESIPAMAWTANALGDVTYFSSRWCEYTNQTQEQALGSGWENVLHPEDLTHTWETWKKALDTSDVYEVENRVKKASDGKYYWFLVRGIPIKNEQGEVLEWVGTCLDINEIKTLQQTLLAASKELASANEELTAANEEILATNEELAETNLRLGRINSDLDNFIYTASHDLKAPIANIEGLMRALISKLPSQIMEEEGVKKITNMIEASINRFRNTILDLTEITRLQKDAEEEKTEIDLKELFEEIKLDLESMINSTSAQITFEASVPSITFSIKNLRSIFYNLISNAIKYHSPDRKPEIKVLFQREIQNYVLIVEDNGLGIDTSQKEKVFSMFKRLHTHVEGSGIGLYIIKRMIENHGGKIELESAVGKGSTFKVYFPFKGVKK